MAGLSIGMKFGEISEVIPNSTLEMKRGADGLPLLSVFLEDQLLLIAYSEDSNGSLDINYDNRISHIETFNSACQTEAGVSPGTLTESAERIYNGITTITKSEMESREYVDFRNQPSKLKFRIDYSGIYTEHPRKTTKYKKGSKILSIGISR